ncbi:MAG: SUMF1/EgtB/PvdO family nonheme iron enzyme [Sedimentisphaerales bacterium]|nr:SUMF1/EgtB/PvdO family nonheme iron enzyme [Sedimentisphaerales bacterium]
MNERPAEKRLGPRSGDNRVNRGGSWNNNARNCRSANRNRNTPGNRNNNLGLRLASTTLKGRTVLSHPHGPASRHDRDRT